MNDVLELGEHLGRGRLAAAELIEAGFDASQDGGDDVGVVERSCHGGECRVVGECLVGPGEPLLHERGAERRGDAVAVPGEAHRPTQPIDGIGRSLRSVSKSSPSP